MEGYGAYGVPMTQGFNIINMAAMERGWVIA
jgi:protease II